MMLTVFVWLLHENNLEIKMIAHDHGKFLSEITAST
jgi:hypothetical protein